MRYEIQTPTSDRLGRSSYLDPSVLNPGTDGLPGTYSSADALVDGKPGPNCSTPTTNPPRPSGTLSLCRSAPPPLPPSPPPPFGRSPGIPRDDRTRHRSQREPDRSRGCSSPSRRRSHDRQRGGYRVRRAVGNDIDRQRSGQPADSDHAAERSRQHVQLLALAPGVAAIRAEPGDLRIGRLVRIDERDHRRRGEYRLRQRAARAGDAVDRGDGRVQGDRQRRFGRIRTRRRANRGRDQIGHEPDCMEACSRSTATVRFRPRTSSPPACRSRHSTATSSAARSAATSSKTSCSISAASRDCGESDRARSRCCSLRRRRRAAISRACPKSPIRTTGLPFSGNVIPCGADQQFREGDAEVRAGPEHRGESGFNYIYQFADSGTERSISGARRLQHQRARTGSWRVTGRRITVRIWTSLGGGTANYGNWGGFGDQSKSLAASYTRLITSSMVNEARFGFLQVRYFRTPQNPDVRSEHDRSRPDCADRGTGRAAEREYQRRDIADSPTFRARAIASAITRSTTISRGSRNRHAIKTGFEVQRASAFNFSNLLPSRGQFDFDGRYTGNAFADFLLGYPWRTPEADEERAGGAEEHALGGVRAGRLDGELAPDFESRAAVRIPGHVRQHAWRIANFDPSTGKLVIIGGTRGSGFAALPQVSGSTIGIDPSNYMRRGPEQLGAAPRGGVASARQCRLCRAQRLRDFLQRRARVSGGAACRRIRRSGPCNCSRRCRETSRR